MQYDLLLLKKFFEKNKLNFFLLFRFKFLQALQCDKMGRIGMKTDIYRYICLWLMNDESHHYTWPNQLNLYTNLV